ncbi:PAS domain-containing protein [Halobaculum rubrum]|uniref:PAS domain-containing protein n=1 Tax=Halobaculum rubrum TaxID=2872158 RepID=UPI001CA3E4C4|nr:PAS domain-containing protein [Halobaculum rubrum]QZX98972.1 PAS domain-containing protein [Halobaculum rubrum]
MARDGSDDPTGTAAAAGGRFDVSGGPTAASTDAVDEALKTRTMDEAPVGITIADATQPDMPLVYANAAFERITGYPPSHAVGRNCRFLQGEATSEEPVARMRAAIERDEATTVEVRNYRRDGELFWNEVTIAPLRDDTGRVTHYVGFQQDVTRRKRAERAAEHRAARIERERVAQRRLLRRLDGVIVDVTEAVTRSTSRTDLERDVVDRIDRTYAGAWIGRYDPGSNEIEVRTTAGSTNGDVAGSRHPLGDATGDGSTVDDTESPGGPVAAAVSAAMSERFVHTEPIDGAPDGVTAVAAIPIHYGDATYGAVGVYTRTDGGFANDERAVLTALGRVVATGLNAIESQRTLREEETVEIEFGIGDHPLSAVAEAAGCTLRHRGALGDRDRPSMLFEASADSAVIDADAIRAAGDESVSVHSVLAETADAAVVELSVPDSQLRTLMAEYGADLTAVIADADSARLSVSVARETLAQSLVEAVTDRYDRVELLGYRRRTQRDRTPPEFVAAVEEELTERQHAALVRAFAAGYFEWPRNADGDEIAATMGIGRSTFHQHLRAAERKLVAAFVGSEPSESMRATGDPN